MRRSLIRNLSPFLAVILLTGLAFSAPSTVSYQGRLTNSAGTPVADGLYSVSFSIWTDSLAGSMIWSESQNVQASGGGLFSTQLGKTQPLGGHLIIHGNDDLYLEVSVAGQPLSPRLLLGTVPNALVSKSLNINTPGTGSLNASVGDDTTKITASHESAMGLIDSYVHLTDDRALLGLKSYNPSLDYVIGDATEINGKMVRNYLDHDDDADGISDVLEELSVRPGTAGLDIQSSRRRYNLMDAFPMRWQARTVDSTTASYATTALEADADVDGVAESGVWQKVDNTEGLSVVGVDVDEDGTPDVGTSSSAKLPRAILKTFFERGDKPTQSQIVDSVHENGASSGVIRFSGDDYEGFHVNLMQDSAVVSTEASNSSGSSSSHLRTRTNELESKLQAIGLLARTSSSNSLTPDSVLEITEAQGSTAKARRLVFVSGSVGTGSLIEVNSVDGDGNGIPEQEISSKIVPTRTQHAINTKGTGAQAGRAASINTETTVDSVVQSMTCDADGDGNPEASSSTILAGKFNGGPATVNLQISLSDAPGSNRTTSSQTSTNLDSVVQIISFLENGAIGNTGQVSSKAKRREAELNLNAINLSDNDRTASHFGGACDSAGASTILEIDTDGDSVPECDIEQIVTPTTSSVAINTKGTGADKNRVISQTTPDGSGFDVTASSKNIGLYVSSTGGCSLTMTDESLGTVDTGIVIDGALKRFGIGVAQPDYPMHHSSGAHLTSGGVWTNASDENLKENFQPVDGADLLDKIGQLPISEWNYKSESDEVKHIGPTAQDFQKVFGIGENDKTISTIDPSGIALAAIKELNKQNQVLQQQNKDLQEQNAQIQRELHDLKAMLQKLADQK